MIGLTVLTLASAALAVPFQPTVHSRGLTGPQGQIFRPVAFRARSGLGVSDKVLSLRAVKDHPTGQDLYRHFIRSEKHEKRHKNEPSETKLKSFFSGYTYVVDVEIGGQQFCLKLDTGSSDTFVARNDFKCVDDTASKTYPQKECGFAQLYTPGHDFKKVDGLTFNTTYLSSLYIDGVLGEVPVKIAGIEVEAKVGVANTASWDGQNVTAGALGLAYPILTHAFKEGAAEMSAESNVVYDPVFTTMWKKGLIDPVFTIALDRDPNGDKKDGGSLTLGGVPAHVEVTGKVAKLPIQYHVLNDVPESKSKYSFYVVNLESVALAGPKPDGKTDPTTQGNNLATSPKLLAAGGGATKDTGIGKRHDEKEDQQALINTRSPFLRFPQKLVDQILLEFDPKPTYDEEVEMWQVDCKCKKPTINFIFDGVIISVDPRDLIIPVNMDEKGEKIACYAALIVGDFIQLGNPFMKNVLATFDIGAAEVRLQARKPY